MISTFSRFTIYYYRTCELLTFDSAEEYRRERNFRHRGRNPFACAQNRRQSWWKISKIEAYHCNVLLENRQHLIIHVLHQQRRQEPNPTCVCLQTSKVMPLTSLVYCILSMIREQLLNHFHIQRKIQLNHKITQKYKS